MELTAFAAAFICIFAALLLPLLPDAAAAGARHGECVDVGRRCSLHLAAAVASAARVVDAVVLATFALLLRVLRRLRCLFGRVRQAILGAAEDNRVLGVCEHRSTAAVGRLAHASSCGSTGWAALRPQSLEVLRAIRIGASVMMSSASSAASSSSASSASADSAAAAAAAADTAAAEVATSSA